MYKKILVPLDGSKLAEEPLDYIVWLAKKTNVEIFLLNVYTGKLAPISHYLREVAEIITLRAHEHKGAQLPPPVMVASVQGDPATEILKFADDKNVDLIAMSTHGHSGMKHWLLGSIADRVVRYSKRPVWLIKPFEVGVKMDYDSKVLVLLDGSALAEQILPYAVYHAGLSEGELVLFNVCEPAEVISALSYHLIPDEYPPQKPLRWEDYVRDETARRQKQCRLYLDQNLAKYNQGKFTVRYEYRLGSASTEITKYLEANPVSLVALTTRGRSGLARWVFGNVAEKVLAASRSPLLIMRPG